MAARWPASQAAGQKGMAMARRAPAVAGGLIVGGVCGASGVALSAVAAHAGVDPVLGTAATLLAIHAAAFVALGLAAASTGGRTLLLAGAVLLLGLALFCGDLTLRGLAGSRLFPMAAPVGGAAVILGWLLVAISGFAVWLRGGGDDRAV